MPIFSFNKKSILLLLKWKVQRYGKTSGKTYHFRRIIEIYISVVFNLIKIEAIILTNPVDNTRKPNKKQNATELLIPVAFKSLGY